MPRLNNSPSSEAEMMDVDVLPIPALTSSLSTMTMREPSVNKQYSLIVGDVNGRVADIFSKISSLHEKHGFLMVILAGDLFASDPDAADSINEETQALLDGKINIPVPTYFSLGRNPLPKVVVERLKANSGELCPNLSILGRKVCLKTAEGFRIVAVGGTYESNPNWSPSGPYDASYTDKDALTASGGIDDVDILITSQWPSKIGDGSKESKAKAYQMRGAQSIADLCSEVKPRYHFSTSPLYFSREPFFHSGPAPRAITRFLSLAPFDHGGKERYMYAFSLEPSAPAPSNLPEDCTASPFSRATKRKHEPEDNFRYSSANSTGHGGDQGRRYAKKRMTNRDKPNTPMPCFFCLGNTETEIHMITSLGDATYMTIAKGPLSTRQTYPELGVPCHMLIIPVAHSPTLAHLSEDDRKNVVVETARHREGLHKFLLSKTKSLGSVTWVISRTNGMHIHWQFMPIPVGLVQKGLVEAAFLTEAQNLSYPRFAKSEEETNNAEDGDYFKVMIWSEGVQKEMIMPFDQNIRFDLQFGRRVIAKLLGLDGRGHWKDCAQSKAEETADSERFKEAFFDFDTMQK